MFLSQNMFATKQIVPEYLAVLSRKPDAACTALAWNLLAQGKSRPLEVLNGFIGIAATVLIITGVEQMIVAERRESKSRRMPL